MIVRQGLLWLSERRGVFNFVRRNGVARRFASRFVAGETIDEGVEAARELARRAITSSLDLLGESVTIEAEAVAARDHYLAMLDQMAAAGVEVNVSVKLTQMGLDIAEDLCQSNMVGILEKARTLGGFVRLDMEGSDYTQRTLDFFARRLFPEYGKHCGVVIQSMLRRSAGDIEGLVALGARVRLCKGAYAEPESVAYQSALDVDKAYVRCLNILMSGEGYPMVATHDPRLIAIAEDRARWFDRSAEEYEFQMLYAMRTEEQARLAAGGNIVRVYLPYGTQWYGYLLRRLAERPSLGVRFARGIPKMG